MVRIEPAALHFHNLTMSSIKKYFSPDVLFIFLISAVVFLPYAFRLTYYLDDWYYVYDGVVAGPKIFHSMFSVDRPIRGYFFDVFFSVFGPHPLPYHLGAYLWRLIAGVGAYWLLNVIWSGGRRNNFLIAILFILYPGYSWWVSAIEYQPMAVSLALQVFSVFFTLLSIRSAGLLPKALYLLGATLTGWAYIALVDYAIGAEVFRFLCIYLFISHGMEGPFVRRVSAVLKAWLPYLAVSLGFVFWRVFLFESDRQATDIGLHVEKFKTSPLGYLTEMGADFYNSIMNAGVHAWFRQPYLRLMDFRFDVPLLGVILTGAVVLLVTLAGYLWLRRGGLVAPEASQMMAREALLLGGLSLLFGVIPVIAFGRFINLSIYSHYGLPVSLAAAILLGGVICIFPSGRLQYILFSVFITASALTHSLIAERTLVLENSLETFWWQASWRIPGLQPDATLVTQYPYERVVDNPLGLPEALNLIYFPEPRQEDPIRYFASTLMPTQDNVEAILAQKPKKIEGYRTHEMVVQYADIMVLTQPTSFSCVRVVDGENFVVSANDPEALRSLFEYSRVDSIRVAEEVPILPAYAFGREPERGWCYYFEKADLAVQSADWTNAARLGDEAFALGLAPQDQVEWFPFVQAYAMTGNADRLENILQQTAANTFFNEQVCTALHRSDSKFAPAAEIGALLEEYVCK